MSAEHIGPFSFAPGTKHFLAKAVEGSKLHLLWKSQGLDVQCLKVEGDLGGTNQGGYTLQNATLSGGVEATATRPSSDAQGTQQTINVTGENAEYAGTQNKLHLTGGVHVKNVDPAVQRTLDATGATADVILGSPKEKSGVKSAVLDGNVVLDMSGVREQAENGAAAKTPFKLHGTADHVAFDQTALTVTLTGNVNLTGDEASQIGTISNVSEEVIHLNADWSVASVDFTGNPGKTVYKGGGGGRK